MLHNVGNVLNSVNVSKDMLQSKLLAIDGATMGKLLDLLLQHREDLGEFITNDPAGRHLPRFSRRSSNSCVRRRVRCRTSVCSSARASTICERWSTRSRSSSSKARS